MIKWVVRLAFVTVLLGIAGTLIILIKNIKTNSETSKVVNTEKDVSIAPAIDSTNTSSNTVEAKQPPSNAVITEQKSNGTFSEKSSIKVDSKAIAEDIAVLQKRDAKKAIEKPAKKAQKKEMAAVAKDNDEKLFNNAELAAIVARIYAAKMRHHFYANCVQINVAPGNNKRAVSQIETYLRGHRFAIAGREEVSKKVKGVQLLPKNGCIRLTIGSF
jgi:hypothetical protein